MSQCRLESGPAEATWSQSGKPDNETCSRRLALPPVHKRKNTAGDWRSQKRAKHSSVAEKEIRKYEKRTDLLLRKTAFQRVVRELMESFGKPKYIFQPNAMLALQEACEFLFGEHLPGHGRCEHPCEEDCLCALFHGACVSNLPSGTFQGSSSQLPQMPRRNESLRPFPFPPIHRGPLPLASFASGWFFSQTLIF
jgi:hypothetical protein